MKAITAGIAYTKQHKVLSILSGVAALLPALLLFATWSLTYEKMHYTAPYMPALVGVGVWIAAVLWLVNRLCVRRTWFDGVATGWGLLSALGIFVMLAAALSKLTYFFMAGAPYFAAAALAALLVLMWCGGLRLKGRAYRVLCAVLTVVVSLTVVLGVFNLQPLYFDTGAVVLAVEDEYQICWCTSTTSTGYVQVGDATYTDSVSGALYVGRTHKVVVPRAVLDAVGGYTVVSAGVPLNRAYLATRTGEVRRSYTFRPVDLSDGLQIYDFSDNHLYTAGAAKAAAYWGDSLDLLIANGDHINDVSADWQIANMYGLLSSVTGGTRPILLTRGNHEAVGSALDRLPRYFASRGDKLYYTVRFGGTLFVVLDLANDMADDNRNIRATADFDAYRAEELEWLQGLVDGGTFADPTIERVVAVCHIAFPLNLDRYFGDTCRQMMAALQTADTQIMLSGHSHRLAYYPAQEGENAAAFPVVLGSLRSDDYLDHEGLGGAHFSGTAVQIDASGVQVRFTNSRHEVIAEYHAG